MATNIEIKAVLSDVAAAEATATRLSGGAPQTIDQVDVFFQSGPGRLELRILGPSVGELIQYERSNLPDARPSHYLIARSSDPQVLLDILTATLGTVGTVKKTRRLFLVGQTQVHIDHVEGLGDFLELEAVLGPKQTETEGRHAITGLLSEFGIDPTRLVAEAYVDLLCRNRLPGCQSA